MKKQVLSMIALLSFVVTLTSVGYSNTGRIKASIPFNFTVGNKTLPAGNYTVERVNSGVETLLIRSSENGMSAATITSGGKNAKAEAAAKLVFHRYGNTYFLAEVLEPGSETARQLPTSSAERNLQKRRSHLAENLAKPEIITVVAQ